VVYQMQQQQPPHLSISTLSHGRSVWLNKPIACFPMPRNVRALRRFKMRNRELDGPLFPIDMNTARMRRQVVVLLWELTNANRLNVRCDGPIALNKSTFGPRRHNIHFGSPSLACTFYTVRTTLASPPIRRSPAGGLQ